MKKSSSLTSIEKNKVKLTTLSLKLDQLQHPNQH